MWTRLNKWSRVKMKWSAACHERGTKKKSKSLTGFEPMTSQTPGGRFIHSSYGELMESEAIILGSYLTRILHTARISNVDVALNGLKEWKMVNFKVNETNVKIKLISMSPAWDKEKIWVPKRIRTYDLQNTGQALYPLELWSSRVPAWCLGGHWLESCQKLRFFLCPTLVTCWLINFHINVSLSLKFPIFHFFTPLSVTSTLLILAVCRTRVKYEPSIMASLFMSSP